MLYFLGGWGVWLDYNVATENDYTMWTVPGIYWQIGGAFVTCKYSALYVPANAQGPPPHSYCVSGHLPGWWWPPTPGERTCSRQTSW
jgi:hypothetical protein